MRHSTIEDVLEHFDALLDGLRRMHETQVVLFLSSDDGAVNGPRGARDAEAADRERARFAEAEQASRRVFAASISDVFPGEAAARVLAAWLRESDAA